MSDELDTAEDAWVAGWSAAAAVAIEREIVRHAPVPDLADVLARARTMDPDAVPADWDDLAHEANREPHVVPLAQARARHRNVPDAGVAMFASALRSEVEHGLRERQMAAIPIAPQRRGRLRVAVAAVVLAAAAILLWFTAPRLLDRLDPTRSHASTEASQFAPERQPEPWEAREPAPPREVVAPIPPATIDVEPAAADSGSTGDVASDTPRRAKRTTDELEADALAAWRAGDLATAERLLLRVAKSGRNRRAELAYGDLFALARQRRGTEGQVAMWRDYLRRFPAGRFADDARGGLCRRAVDAAAARTCWQDYLQHHPSGTHATEAARWTSP